MSEIVVRLGAPEEIRRISHLKQQIHDLHVQGRPDLFAPLTNTAGFGLYAMQSGLQLVLAESGEQLMGYALIRYVDRPANAYVQAMRYVHIEEFCVDNACRRMGAGRAMMDFIRQDAKEKGFPRIELDVWAFNEEAVRFYEAMGLRTYRSFLEMEA